MVTGTFKTVGGQEMNEANWGTLKYFRPFFSLRVGPTAWQVSESSHTAIFRTGEEPTLHCSSSHFIWLDGNSHFMNKVTLSTRPWRGTLAKKGHKAKESSEERKCLKQTFLPCSFKLFKGPGFWKLYFFNGQMAKLNLLCVPTATSCCRLQGTRMLSNKK